MAGIQPVRLTFGLLWLALAGGPVACFDYEAQLDIGASGVVDATIHVEQPDWDSDWPDLPSPYDQRLFPDTVTGLQQHFGAGIHLDRQNRTRPSGFHGRFSRVEALSHPPLSYRLVFDQRGAYRLTITIEASPALAEAVAEAADMEVRRLGFLDSRRAATFRQQAPEQYGFRLSARLPGMVTATDGDQHHREVHWKVPLSAFHETTMARVFAEGVLQPWEIALHRWAQGGAVPFPLLPLTVPNAP